MANCFKCKADMEDGTRFCDECGAEIEPGAGFCDSCGCIVGGAVQSKPAASVLSSSGGAAYGLRLINKKAAAPVEAKNNKETQAAEHFAAGEKHFKNADYESAIAELSKAIELVQNNIDYYLRRAMTWTKLQKPQDAISDLDEVIKMNPGLDYVYNLKGVCCRAVKDYKRAVEAYEKAIELNPANQSYKDSLEKVKENK